MQSLQNVLDRDIQFELIEAMCAVRRRHDGRQGKQIGSHVAAYHILGCLFESVELDLAAIARICGGPSLQAKDLVAQRQIR